MQIVRSLDKPILVRKPVVLTIGNFDSLHLGHQAVLNRLKTVAKALDTFCAVITFENHPVEILRPECKFTTLYSLPHKIRLMEQFGIDLVLLLKFTKEFSQLSADEFLRKVYAMVPFSHLILGHDATFGKGKQGDRNHVQEILRALHSHVEYLDPLALSGRTLSSSMVRALVQEGNIAQASELLGRPYSIYAPITSIRDSTAEIDAKGLSLPPAGIYQVKLLFDGKLLLGTAHVNGLLRVALKDVRGLIVAQNAEVVFSG